MTEKKFAIEWHSIARDIMRNWWVIICAAVIGILGTYVVKHVIYHPEYTSRATVIVNSAAGKSNAVASLSDSEKIAQIYAEVFIQPTMKEKVCEYLGKKRFDGRINARVNNGTNIMELSVTASDPEEAYRELTGILKVYPQITATLYANGVVSVLRPASVPRSPSNNMTSASAIKIALISMALAFLLIVLLSVVRDTVKDERTFKEKIDAHLLGTIPHERKYYRPQDVVKGKKRGLLFSESVFTSLKFTENFNKIAAKLEYMRRMQGQKVFAVTSVAENEGKSTVASNLAVALALKGSRVVLLDLDCKKPALYKIFEQAPEERSEIGRVLSGELEKKDFRFLRYRKTNLFLALNSKPQKDYQKWFEDGRVREVLNALKDSADYVIVDTAPVSVDGSMTSVAELCDAVILTVRTDTVYAPVINDMILTLENTGSHFAGCILNDTYEDFSFFKQFGTDETGYSRYAGYGKYGKYSKYGKYGKYTSRNEKTSDGETTPELEEIEILPEQMPQIAAGVLPVDAPVAEERKADGENAAAQTEAQPEESPAAADPEETDEAQPEAGAPEAAQAEESPAADEEMDETKAADEQPEAENGGGQ